MRSYPLTHREIAVRLHNALRPARPGVALTDALCTLHNGQMGLTGPWQIDTAMRLAGWYNGVKHHRCHWDFFVTATVGAR